MNRQFPPIPPPHCRATLWPSLRPPLPQESTAWRTAGCREGEKPQRSPVLLLGNATGSNPAFFGRSGVFLGRL